MIKQCFESAQYKFMKGNPMWEKLFHKYIIISM